jgi:hypothetical protein
MQSKQDSEKHKESIHWKRTKNPYLNLKPIWPVKKQPTTQKIHPMKHTKQFGIVMGLIAGLAAIVANKASADLVTGWGLETGAQNATLTEGAPGSFSVTTPTGNAAPRALLPSLIDFSAVGDVIQLSGTVSFANTLGNEQFRFGLFNTNNSNPGTLSGGLWLGANPVGWLGYLVEPGNGGGTTRLVGRTGANAGTGWSSATATTPAQVYDINSIPTTTSPPPGTYSVSLTLTRTGPTSVNISYLFSGGSYTTSTSFTDNNLGPSASMTSFNAVGFLLNANTGAGAFSGVDVSVPEPSTFVLAGLGLAGLVLIRARRRQV